MTTDEHVFPHVRHVADRAVLVEFGAVTDIETQRQVSSLDTRLAQSPFDGLTEAIPGFASLLVCFDPTITDHTSAEKAIRSLLFLPVLTPPKGHLRLIDVCYDTDAAPDLKEVSAQTGLSEEAVINQHLAATYHVVMYGFAPGYAYLDGGPAALHLPRKSIAKRGVAAGSVIIAGAQCLITTLTMPTGWWIIGQSPIQILTNDPVRPFLFDVGDVIQFRRVKNGDLTSPKRAP